MTICNKEEQLSLASQLISPMPPQPSSSGSTNHLLARRVPNESARVQLDTIALIVGTGNEMSRQQALRQRAREFVNDH
jgi:hypothetical protein